MQAVYRWYARSCTRLGCNPAFIAVAIVVLAFAYVGSAALYQHRSQLITAGRFALAFALALAAVALLAKAAHTVAAAEGNHCDLAPAPRPEPVPRPVRVERPGEPAHSYTLRTPAETAAMTADADALAEDDTGIVVSADGTVYELMGEEP
jgi:hypothetical protein